jgi:hypothetical protein
MFALFNDTSDGYLHDVRVARPFYAVHTPWSVTTALFLQDQEDRNWFRGNEIEEFQRRRDRFAVDAAIGTSVGGARVRRWRAGAVFDDSRFDFSESLLRPQALADDRRYTYLFVGMESTEDRFVETTNLNFIARPEDVFVGEAWRASLGWSAAAFGADRDHLVLDADYGRTLWYDPGRLWQAGARVGGFLTPGGRAENLRWQVDTRYFHRQTERTATAMRLEGTWVAGQTRDQQLLLGGKPACGVMNAISRWETAACCSTSSSGTMRAGIPCDSPGLPMSRSRCWAAPGTPIDPMARRAVLSAMSVWACVLCRVVPTAVPCSIWICGAAGPG